MGVIISPPETIRTARLVVRRLSQVEADLLEAKRTMAHRLQALLSHLPADDPDRGILAACLRDLVVSVRLQERALARAAAQAGAEDRSLSRSLQ
jgi:hypothetical protein